MNCRQAKRSARFGVSAGLCLVLAVASCAGPQEVKIGALISETGAAATYGKQVKQGLELALDEINSSGGVLKGRRLVIDYRDDGTNPSKARQAVQDLVDTAKVRAVIGTVASEPALGALEAARQREIVLLSPSASSPQLATEGNGWFFRNFPSDSAEGQAVARLCREMGLRSMAVVAVKNVFGRGIAEIFTNELEQGDAKVSYREDFDSPLSETGAAAMAQRIVGSNADGVYIAGYIDDVVSFLGPLRAAGMKGPRFATSAMTPDIVRLAGAAAEKLIFPQAFDIEGNRPELRRFIEAYRNKFNQPPPTYAAYGYDALRVLAAAIDQTHVAAPDEIRAALAGVSYPGVTGRIDFDERGDVVREPHFFVVVRGEVVHFEDLSPAIRGLLTE
jgi:branched-chain amino acid transport system substrate-binding protein